MKDIFFDLHLFSKYRSALMGLATIGILMCHAPANGVCLPFHLNSILGLGQMGVMVFFFVSGIGLYFSTRTMEYNSKSIIAWYRKRLVRLFVPYVILYAPYLYIIMSNSPSMNLGGYLLHLSTLSYWIDHTGCWFVDIIIPLYLLTPLWNKLLEKVAFPVIPTIIVFFLLSFVSNPYEDKFFQASFFFIGFWLGPHVKNGAILSKKGLLAGAMVIALMLAGYCFFGIGRLLQILMLPTAIILCWLLEAGKSNTAVRILNFFGTISLESYILNVTLIVWIEQLDLIPDTLYAYRYVFIVVFGVILAIATNRLCAPIIAKLGN